MAKIALKEDDQSIYTTIGYQLFLMHQVKKPLMEGIEALVSKETNLAEKLNGARKVKKAYENFQKMPEPTTENTSHPNTHNIIHLRDWFCARCRLAPMRVTFVRTIFNGWAIINEMDPPWRMMMDKVKAEGDSLCWAPPGYGGAPTDFPWWNDEIY